MRIETFFQENTLKKTIPQVLYFFFFSILSSIGVGLAYIPFILIGVIQMLMFGEILFIFQEFQFLLSIFVPLIILLPFFLFLKKIQSVKKYFLLTFCILIVSYAYSFYFLLLVQQYILIPGILFLVVFYSGVLTYVYKKLFREKHPEKSFLFLILLFLDIFLIVGDFTPNGNIIFSSYLLIGEFLAKISRNSFNIFYLDYSNFSILFLNTINAVMTLVLFLLIPIEKIKRGKQ